VLGLYEVFVMTRLIVKTCKQCGKKFRWATTRRNRHNFCSGGCADEWMKAALIRAVEDWKVN
jgi:endogenous inhibitor of DNA gyrase (YacG/DUF329 family)